jgi:hypothetical protein
VGGVLQRLPDRGHHLYYLDLFDYPAQKWGLFQPPLTPFAQSLLPWLPLNVLPEGQQDLYLLALVIVLLILRVIR